MATSAAVLRSPRKSNAAARWAPFRDLIRRPLGLVDDRQARSAQVNSSASIPRPRMIAAHPGPGREQHDHAEQQHEEARRREGDAKKPVALAVALLPCADALDHARPGAALVLTHGRRACCAEGCPRNPTKFVRQPSVPLPP